MKHILQFLLSIGLWSISQGALAQCRVIAPPDPVEIEKMSRVDAFIKQAYAKVRANDIDGAIALFESAATVEKTYAYVEGHHANTELARLYKRLNRPAESLRSFAKVYTWNPRTRDLDSVIGGRNFALEYAILLAQQGRSEDAKAMYYYGLRWFNLGSRHAEPAPMLVVFDPEPEGIVWEYSPDRLEAAATMLQAMSGEVCVDSALGLYKHKPQLVARVRELAPDWFYPHLITAAGSWRSPEKWALHTARAEARARPGLEQEIVAKFRLEHAEHLVINAQNQWTDASDDRPMMAGVERRKRMLVLKPNEAVLRRISRQPAP